MKKIIIENIRNIKYLEFEMPRTGLYVLTGENGVGKTTLFTCINRIGNKNAYRQGFISATNNLLDVFSGTITYISDNDEVIYSRRPNGEWRPNKKNSTVFSDFGYPQVINITTKEKRIFSQNMVIPRRNNSPDIWLNSKLNTIFETQKFSDMISVVTGDCRGRGGNSGKRGNTAYIIPLGNDCYYTEGNFSFGEIVMINLLYDIKNTINGSLILIDELELALHPAAQLRLMQILKEIANEKGLTIIISTHSSSIIKAEKNVIFIEKEEERNNIIYECPPAKAIGAIGIREDTVPDIVVLVEDCMAKSFFNALEQKYFCMQNDVNFLDIRILEIGGFNNVIHFYVETKNYIFYDNTYVVAFMDKDVETDIMPYSRFGNQEVIRKYEDNAAYLHFLPYTPEVYLVKTFYTLKRDFLRYMKGIYNNQQLQYSTLETFDFTTYEASFPEFANQNEYNNYIEMRGIFRKKCKTEAERIATVLANQINCSEEEIYRIAFKFSVDNDATIDPRTFLSSTMKRIRR